MKWDTKRFSQIIRVAKGQAITRAGEEEGPYPVILGGQEPAYYINRYNHEGKAIVVSRSGASAGFASFWNEPIFITDGFLVEPLPNNSTEYVFYLFKYYGKVLRDLQNGSAIPHVTPKTIYSLRAPIPPEKEQSRIAEVLSAYDNLIEVNYKRIKVLEQMAENLYKEWFVRFRFPGRETAEFENGIPKGWAYKRADEVIEFNPTLKTGNQTEFTIIPMEALSTNSMVLDSSCFVRQDSILGRRSQNGDTLLAKITPCLENGKTGFVMGMPAGEVLGGSTEFVVMRSKALTPHYVYFIARSEYFRQTAILSMNGADGRQRVDEDKLKSTKILQPEKTVLDSFEMIVTPIFDCVYQMTRENKNLIHQRDLLLPRLMSGKLEV